MGDRSRSKNIADTVVVQEGETIDQLGGADHSGLRCLAVESGRLSFALALELTRRGEGEMAEVAQAPYAVEALSWANSPRRYLKSRAHKCDFVGVTALSTLQRCR